MIILYDVVGSKHIRAAAHRMRIFLSAKATDNNRAYFLGNWQISILPVRPNLHIPALLVSIVKYGMLHFLILVL